MKYSVKRAPPGKRGCGAFAGKILGRPQRAHTKFSMPPQMIPEIKYIIRSVKIVDAQEMALNALKLSTAKEVEDYTQARLQEILK